jgi:hypothetical protein
MYSLTWDNVNLSGKVLTSFATCRVSLSLDRDTGLSRL